MDFSAICQGLGLAIAAGLILGAVFPAVMPTWGVVVGSAPLGIIAAGAALQGADEAVWPAVPIGVIGAGIAALVSADVASGAARRERDRTTDAELEAPSGVTVIMVVCAVIVAAVSVVVPPVSLVALAALCWLWLSRRRQEARKHEGLRVLK